MNSDDNREGAVGRLGDAEAGSVSLDDRLKEAAVRAVSWQSVSAGTLQLVTAVVALVVAARTTPQQFALWGVAVILIQFQFILRLGLGQALIFFHFPTREDLQREADSAFSLTVALAAVTSIAVFVLAPRIAPFFGEGFSQSAVILTLRVTCVTFFFLVSEAIPIGLIERTMDFRRRSRVEISTALVYAVLAVALLFGGLGAWSLILAKVVQSGARAVAFWWSAPLRPRLRVRIDLAGVKRMVRYGSVLTASGIVGFGIGNFDNLTAAHVLGATALGLYALAYTISNFIPTFLLESLVRVFFPMYAALRHSAPALHATFLASVRVLAAVMVPTSCVLIALGPQLLVEVLGPQWSAAGHILQVLALYGLARSVSEAANSMRSATGRPAQALAAHVTTLAVSLAALWPCLSLGTVGIALAFTAGQVAGASVGLLIIPREWRAGFWRLFVAPVAATLAGLGAAYLVSAIVPASVAAIVGTGVFALVYWPTLLALDRSLRHMLMALLPRWRQVPA
jgi:Membrane protein involved in the export of O-antigen and teichoic acid